MRRLFFQLRVIIQVPFTSDKFDVLSPFFNANASWSFQRIAFVSIYLWQCMHHILKQNRLDTYIFFFPGKVFKWFPCCLTPRVPSPFHKKLFLSRFANSHFYYLLHKEFLPSFFISVMIFCLRCQRFTFYCVRKIIHEFFSVFVCDHYIEYMQNERKKVWALVYV